MESGRGDGGPPRYLAIGLTAWGAEICGAVMLAGAILPFGIVRNTSAPLEVLLLTPVLLLGGVASYTACGILRAVRAMAQHAWRIDHNLTELLESRRGAIL